MLTSNPSPLSRPLVNNLPLEQLRGSDSQKAPSIMSSRMTDIASENSYENNPEGSAIDGRTATSQYGRALTDPSRPPSAMSSQTRNSNRASQSRRGATFVGGYRVGESFGGPGGTMWNTSRPPSVTSQASKTHVPSLASQAFFRPMSSQRLQARRGRQTETSHFETSLDESGEAGSNAVRHSLTSVKPVLIHHHSTILPPPSGRTEFTDPEDRITLNASPNGDTTARSSGESGQPLQGHSIKPEPTGSDPGLNENQGTGGTPSVQKPSPKSFRSKILLSTTDKFSDHDTRGHERLSSSNNSPRSTPLGDAPSRMGRNYQHFAGNTLFCLGGRLQNARDMPVNIATGIFVVIPTFFFLFYSAPWFWQNASAAIPIIFAYISFICISSLIHASVTDPGILPRNLDHIPPPANADDPLTLAPQTMEWTRIKYAGRETSAMDVPVKFCKTCNIWRPPRCHHCRICDNCIETQDHHCIWINNCVGRRNYRYFFTFVSSGTILGLYLIGASLFHCLRYQSANEISFAQAVDHLKAPFAMVVYGVLATSYPACLWVYHLFLTGKGETTREFLNSQKFPKKDRHHPFTNGSLVKNWLAALLRPRPPTYLQFKRSHEEGDQRFESQMGVSRSGKISELQGLPITAKQGIEMGSVGAVGNRA